MNGLVHILEFINLFIFTGLSGLHVYWALGGTWALKGAIPEAFSEGFFEAEKKPGFVLATWIVAIGLLGFGLISANSIRFESLIGEQFRNYALLGMSIIFLLRTVGDFKTFGLFGKRTDHIFSQRDRRIYVPLCLYLGLSSLVLYFYA